MSDIVSNKETMMEDRLIEVVLKWAMKHEYFDITLNEIIDLVATMRSETMRSDSPF